MGYRDGGGPPWVNVCLIEHKGGLVMTKGRVTEALLCSGFLLLLPGYPCPQILAMEISYHGGGSSLRSPPGHLTPKSVLGLDPLTRPP
jgi:hypothetical protein